MNKSLGINRDKYLNELIKRMNNGLIKVITGLRRCGKTYLLNEIFYKYLISINVKKDHIIIISLEDLENRKYKDPYLLNEHVKSLIRDDGMYYIMIDEIQEVNDFVPLLNTWIKNKQMDVYVTGSNSRFLSKDIITEFRGRGDIVHLFPLSFKEFYEYRKGNFDEIFDEFLHFGGMPFILKREDKLMKINYLKDLYREIYIKDIKERYKIRNDSELVKLLCILASSVGSLTNLTKLEHTFKSVKKVSASRNTINAYLEILEDSYLVKKSLRYDIKGKKYINSLNKIYFTDLGLRNALLNFREFEIPHLMENLIFNELSIRGYALDIGIVESYIKNEKNNNIRTQIEIDFIASRGDTKYYIQSVFNVFEEAKLIQEIRPFTKVNDSFKKILIFRENISPRIDENGIIMISLKDFLLDENILEKC